MKAKFKREFKTPWRAFYVASGKFAGAGIKGSIKRTGGEPAAYIVQAGGNLKRL